MKSALSSVLLLIVVTAYAGDGYRDRIMQISRDYSAGNDVLLTIYTDSNDDVHVYVIDEVRYASTPEWEGRGNPPLSYDDAIRRAHSIISSRHPLTGTLELTTFTLQRIDTERITNRWFYSLTLSERMEDEEDDIDDDWDEPASSWINDSWTIYLLMDGSEVEPRKHVEN